MQILYIFATKLPGSFWSRVRMGAGSALFNLFVQSQRDHRPDGARDAMVSLEKI
jgi:hypothetical protein